MSVISPLPSPPSLPPWLVRVGYPSMSSAHPSYRRGLHQQLTESITYGGPSRERVYWRFLFGHDTNQQSRRDCSTSGHQIENCRLMVESRLQFTFEKFSNISSILENSFFMHACKLLDCIPNWAYYIRSHTEILSALVESWLLILTFFNSWGARGDDAQLANC